MRTAAIRAGLESLYFSGTHRLVRPLLGGMGAILTFHRVRPNSDDAFQPNHGLEIVPSFLDEIIAALKRSDIEIVPIGEAHRRLTAGESDRRFVVLSFDDGYRDNLEYALPILERHKAPFVIYVAAAFADGAGALWWVALEEAIARNALIEVDFDGVKRRFDCSTAQAKCDAFHTVYWWLRHRPTEAELRTAVGAIVSDYGVDMAKQCRDMCMGWEELAILAANPLATIGSHTTSHPFLAKLPAESARAEMAGANRRIEEKLGIRPEHFAYPVGDDSAAGRREFALASELGFKTAVTTRPGVLFAEHGAHLTALPRISINGEYQRLRYVDVLLSGAPTALLNGFRRVVPA